MIDLDAWRELARAATACGEDGPISAALLLACDEVASLRATVSRLNRRAQAAEATLPFEKTRARAQRNRHDAHRAELALLRAGLSEACDQLADALEYLMPYHRAKWGYDATLVRLRALLPSDTAPRATLDRMSTIPTLETHCKIAISTTGARVWSSMTEAEQTDMKARIRGLIDYAFGASADGAIYALGPSDPPPTVPPT